MICYNIADTEFYDINAIKALALGVINQAVVDLLSEKPQLKIGSKAELGHKKKKSYNHALSTWKNNVESAEEFLRPPSKSFAAWCDVAGICPVWALENILKKQDVNDRLAMVGSGKRPNKTNTTHARRR